VIADPINRTCEACGAPAGKPCLGNTGRALPRFHMPRRTGFMRSPEQLEKNRIHKRAMYTPRSHS